MEVIASYTILVGIYIFLIIFSLITIGSVKNIKQPLKGLFYIFLGITAIKSAVAGGWYIEGLYSSESMNIPRLIIDYVNALGFIVTVVAIRALAAVAYNQNISHIIHCEKMCKNYDAIAQTEHSVFDMRHLEKGS